MKSLIDGLFFKKSIYYISMFYLVIIFYKYKIYICLIHTHKHKGLGQKKKMA